ncbi:tRNA(m5U54)methyltransferase [Massospora cicadina]|nr:tRNA(m5U54)methyltransferase [Massospora cicadina]
MEFRKTLFTEYLPYERFETYELEIVKISSNGENGRPVNMLAHAVGVNGSTLITTSKSLKVEHLKRAFLYGSRPILHLIPFDSPESLRLILKLKKDKISMPAIGFQIKGRKNILDIEECILATPAVNSGYRHERERVAATYDKYPRGATLIIRESVAEDGSTTTVTEHKAQVTQKVGDVKFKYPAGSFFQINGSILTRLTEYVMDEIKTAPGLAQPPRFLLDVYCGSGLFAVACSRAFERVVGVDVSDQSISCASGNAAINDITNCAFKLGNAEVIFEDLDFRGENTAVIIDPPRKGCSQDFIRQLIEFGPSVIVYVSCNPFSQAQDLLHLLTLCGGDAAQKAIAITKTSTSPKGTIMSHQEILDLAPEYVFPIELKDEQAWETFSKSADKDFVAQYKKYLAPPLPSSPTFTYRIVKAKPFDMFPQTKHIESMLTLVKAPIDSSNTQ